MMRTGHSDFAPCVHPGYATLLHCIEAPDHGGATLFADLLSAYEALPAATQRQHAEVKLRISCAPPHHNRLGAAAVMTCRAASDISRLPELETDSAFGRNLIPLHGVEGARQLVTSRRPDVEHPLVRRLPNGRSALWLGDSESSSALGEPVAEGEEKDYIQRVRDFATAERFTYAHKWEHGDLTIWVRCKPCPSLCKCHSG